MALLFAANSSHPAKKRETIPFDQRMQSAGLNAKHQAHAHGQVIPISNFYNMMLDYADLVADFEAWEANRGKFSFCQYPFFLSIWAKIHILEHDAGVRWGQGKRSLLRQYTQPQSYQPIPGLEGKKRLLG